jgi:hypothetical protein
MQQWLRTDASSAVGSVSEVGGVVRSHTAGVRKGVEVGTVRPSARRHPDEGRLRGVRREERADTGGDVVANVVAGSKRCDQACSGGKGCKRCQELCLDVCQASRLGCLGEEHAQ